MSVSVYCSNLKNDQGMIRALGSVAVPYPLDVGDACFSGIGVDGKAILVCVERKKIGDVCRCINDGRYLYQAQSAKEAGYDVLCLIVEGKTRPGPKDGLLEVPVWGISPRTMRRAEIWEPVKPAMAYSRFDQYLTELDWLVGIIVKRSQDVRETAAIIKALWDNFQTPPDRHRSLKSIYKAPLSEILLVKPSLVRRVAAELPHIGWDRSLAVSRHFQSVRDMAVADAGEWMSIDGIGKKIAEEVVRAVGGS